MRLSRHARNNMRLYKFSEVDIMSALASPDEEKKEGNRMTAIKPLPGRFAGYPLKVVYETIGEEVAVITAYPLKKKEWR